MPGLRGPALIDSLYGALGSGEKSLTIGGVSYPVDDLLVRMSLNFQDSRAIDGLALPGGRFVFRYYDGQDQRVVAMEFDDSFRCLGEVRAHYPENVGDEEWYPQHCGH